MIYINHVSISRILFAKNGPNSREWPIYRKHISSYWNSQREKLLQQTRRIDKSCGCHHRWGTQHWLYLLQRQLRWSVNHFFSIALFNMYHFVVKRSKSIFYNRVNKCGSASMLELLKDLGNNSVEAKSQQSDDWPVLVSERTIKPTKVTFDSMTQSYECWRPFHDIYTINAPAAMLDSSITNRDIFEGLSNDFTSISWGLPKLRTLKEKDKRSLGVFLCDESLPRSSL